MSQCQLILKQEGEAFYGHCREGSLAALTLTCWSGYTKPLCRLRSWTGSWSAWRWPSRCRASAWWTATRGTPTWSSPYTGGKMKLLKMVCACCYHTLFHILIFQNIYKVSHKCKHGKKFKFNFANWQCDGADSAVSAECRRMLIGESEEQILNQLGACILPSQIQLNPLTIQIILTNASFLPSLSGGNWCGGRQDSGLLSLTSGVWLWQKK